MASSSKEKQNFQCVTEASLDLIKLPLKDILRSQIKPEDLFQKINSSLLSRRIKLRPDQLKLCCFPPPDIPDYSKFDVTLLYTLIRNLCTCPGLEPSRGWGNEPGPKDTQIGDDIERLRLFRNINYAHLSSAAIPDDTFKELYETLKSVFNRLKSHPGCSVDYEQELIETKCLKFRYEKWDTGRFFLENYMERDKRAGLPYEPDISINGKDEVICGDSVEFQANVDQSVFPVWSITWQKRRGENIRCIDISEEKYSGSTNTKLLIRSACKGDEGEYSAFLSRESNRKKYTGSNTISLLVIGELPFLNDLEVSTEEEKIIIHYNYGVLEKSPSVQHIEWRKNDKLLNLEKEKYIGGNLQAKTFTIISPSKDDRGIYSCTVKNAVGPVTKFVNFDIPRVELSVESNGFFGSKATIRCMVSSCPLPEKVQWQKSKDKRVFLSIDITAPAYIGSRDVPKSAILVIPKISFDDKLFYRLLVWNKIGQNYSNIIYLNVTGSPPNITVSQETNINNRSVKLCGNVFVYDNSPCILGVYWTKDGEKIDIKENGGRFSQVTVDEPSLNIKDVNLDDIGDYQLTATNAVGSTKSDVIKLGPPSLLLEKQKDESTGRLRFTLTIQSFPAPCHIQWSAKVNDDDIFTPIDINAEEYKGTTEYLPHPVLVVNQGNQLEKYTFKVEVNSFVGSTIELFSGQKYPSIIKKEGSLENTLYKDKGAGLKFAILNNDLANQFPVEKLKLLKFIIQSSGKVEDVTSLKSADSAMECFIILQDENIFSKRDVIFIQFLCKVTECKELYEKCKDYALSQNALCYFERQIENGYTNVQFHVQGDLNNYTKENIQNIVETVAGILNCRTDEILVNGVHHSRSFMLVLSLKDIYTSKLMTLSEQDCHHLTRQHIDYFILNQKIFQLASSKDLVESKITVLDEELQFAKLCGDLANDFPLQKFQQLRSILSASKKTRNMESLMAANSVLECFTILLDENLFSKADVSLIQFLCKETNCEELHNKCAEYSRGQEIHFCKEDLVESKLTVLDEELQFAKLCVDSANDFPLQKFQQLRSIQSEKSYARSINLPSEQIFRNLNNARCLALDIGGSLAKLAYCSRIHRRMSQVLDRNESTESSPSQHIYEVCEEDEYIDRLHFVKFETKFIESCLDFIQQKLGDSLSQNKTIHVTGGGAHKYKDLLASKLGVVVEKEDEMSCLIEGCNFLLKNIPDEAFLYQRHTEPTYKFQGVSRDIFPFLLVNIGSGVRLIKVESEDTYQRIGGTSTGGGTFWGLGSLLTKAKTFDDLLELAEQGDHREVDMLVKDIYGGAYSSIGLSGDIIASSFGKAARSPKKSEDMEIRFKEADIARSLLLSISNDIGQIAYLHAKLHGLNKIYFGGYFIRGHPLTMHTITYAINFWSKGEINALFLRHEGYLGAIGAFIRGAKEEDTRGLTWGENLAGSSGLGSYHKSHPWREKKNQSSTFEMLELNQLDRALLPCPLLLDQQSYLPDTVELTEDIAAREYWLACFTKGVHKTQEQAIKSQQNQPDAMERAEKFTAKYIERLTELKENPCAYGSLTVRSLLDTSSHYLQEFMFNDPYLQLKRTENEQSLKYLAQYFEELDRMKFEDRQLALAKGVIAGNVFDWGAREVTQIMETQSFGFKEATDKLQERPWLFDDFDAWLSRIKGKPHKCAAIFVDNSGADIILGIFPFIRDMLFRGTKVILCANSRPALNDVIYNELVILVKRVAEIDPQINEAYSENRLMVMETGQGSPCLDLRLIDCQLVDLMNKEETDLVIIEGMGRAIHTNFDACFSCEALKIAVIKNRWLANRLGGDMFSVMFKYEAPRKIYANTA